MPGVKGNSGGKKGRSGRKPKAVEQELVDILDQAWPLAERVACIRKHALQAKGGDVKSFQILMNYTYGKPTETHEHGGQVEHTVTIARIPSKLSKAKWQQPKS